MTPAVGPAYSVSVIIPVYNGARYLAEAIESILAQTFAPFEIIVIDDGSTDQSAEVAKLYTPAVSYHWQEHTGPGAARNLGVRLSTGALLAFLDADDLWVPDKLELQVGMLQRKPQLDMVFGQTEQFVSPDVPAEQHSIKGAQAIIDGLHAGTMLARRSSFDRVGYFATTWRIGEFIDWYGRAVDLGLQIDVLGVVVMRRRIHAANMTRQAAQSRDDYLKILKARLDRQRNREDQ